MSQVISSEAAELVRRDGLDLSVGDIFTEANARNFYRVDGFEIIDGELVVHHSYRERDEWRKASYSPMKWSRFSQYVKLDCSIEEAYQEGRELVESGQVPQMFVSDDEPENPSAVLAVNSKGRLLEQEKALVKTEEKARRMAAKMTLYIERKKAEMQRMVWELERQMEQMRTQMTRIRRIITSIELYLGINEELVQIREGVPAPEDYPIYFRQMMLYMDEELAILGNGGADINDVEKFDEWLLKPGNLESCLPEQKGMVVFRYRRSDKDYGDKWENMQMRYWNSRTFVLIRNGENVYRIFTENINISPRLFPKRAEFQELLSTVKAMNDESRHFFKSDREKIESQHHRYMAQALFMQGLIDRTQVFSPMSERLDLFNLDAHPGKIVLLYDEEDGLPDGRMRFLEWKDSINEQISEGSRIIISSPNHWTSRGYTSKKDFSDHYFVYNSEWSLPNLPSSGIYTVEAVKKEKCGRYDNGYFVDDNGEIMTFLYNPGDEVNFGKNWEWDPHPRKNRVRFMFNRKQPWVLNYDLISLADIEFYLHCRVDRPNYLTMLPLLIEAKENRLRELAWEMEFVRLICDRAVQQGSEINLQEMEAMVWRSIEWWKNKVKWKRPILKDDTKALRMIERRINLILSGKREEL